jgi:minor extracellular serine protease Vpr
VKERRLKTIKYVSWKSYVHTREKTFFRISSGVFMMKRRILNLFLVLTLVLAVSSTVFAQDGGPDRYEGREIPAALAELKLEEPIEISGMQMPTLSSDLVGAAGPSRVIIRLSADSGGSAITKGVDPQAAKADAKAQQDAFLNRLQQVDPNARVIGQVQLVLNAVFVETDASKLPEVAEDPAVVRIARVGEYEMDLSETVPYIGAADVQSQGYDGSGIKVAVLDSGIDYTHAALGGSGDPDEYANNDPSIIEPGSFPTAKVVGGYDFVGADWPNAPEAPDPDPLDAGPSAGHGTHVAHIIGGVGGVAPGVDLYAVKVCSSVSTACSGVALIQGMEFAADPNGDGMINDRVDIINMSLGSPYGQPFDDDLSAAVDNASAMGILTVASAGNSSDKPYAVGTPSAAKTALSVAQTSVPSAFLPLMEVTAPASIAGLYQAIFQPWSMPLTSVITAPLIYGDGAGGNLNGCAAFTPGSLAGKIVLVDRGACNFSLKISNISQGGGLIGIIGLIAPGDPFEGGDGGERPIDIPGYMISQAVSNRLKSGLPDTVVTFDPESGIPLIGSMVGSSSRGPQHENTTLIKPEIGAPGASVSAIAGTGTGEGPFGGTSGAAPMVTGSAALLLEGYKGSNVSWKDSTFNKVMGKGLKPVEVKALLMNNADTDIVNDAVTGALAPITRIGGGEVRVDQALFAPVAAWDNDVPTGALGFGFVDVADNMVNLTKFVRVRNYSDTSRTYSVTPTFRFADDEANGAVTVSAPSSVTVKGGQDTLFKVTLRINGAMLPGNYMNSGTNGANPASLTMNEYDGYLLLDDGKHPIHLAWHVLPRKAARLIPLQLKLKFDAGVDTVPMLNTGVGTAQNDAYSLLALSKNEPAGGSGEQSPTPDIRAVGVNTFPVPAGYCSGQASFIWAFAINTWERQQHLMPVHHYVYLDINQDGVDDYVVFNSDLSGFGSLSDGRHVTYAQNLSTGAANAFFYTEHSTNTGNTILYVCGEQVGLTGTDMLATNVNMSVYTQDWYFGGPGDTVEGLTVTPLGEQYYGMPNDIPGRTFDKAGIVVQDYGPWPGNTPELGVMLVTNGDRGAGNRGGATQWTEVLFLLVP